MPQHVNITPVSDPGQRKRPGRKPKNLGKSWVSGYERVKRLLIYRSKRSATGWIPAKGKEIGAAVGFSEKQITNIFRQLRNDPDLKTRIVCQPREGKSPVVYRMVCCSGILKYDQEPLFSGPSGENRHVRAHWRRDDIQVLNMGRILQLTKRVAGGEISAMSEGSGNAEFSREGCLCSGVAQYLFYAIYKENAKGRCLPQPRPSDPPRSNSPP